MEDALVDINDFREMLADHLDPIKETIARLEKQNEKIIDIMANQAAIAINIGHLESDLKEFKSHDNNVHDTLFEKIRKVEEKSGDKLWDVLKLIIAAAFGGLVAALVGKR